MSDQSPPTPITGALPISRYRRFESFREYETLFDAMVPQTEAIIRVFDRVLPQAWNEKPRIELLRQFLLRNRVNKLMIVLHVTDNIERKIPRLVELINYFSHAVKIRQTPRMAHHVYDPFIIFDASHYLRRFHHAHMRAAQGTHDVEGTLQLLDRHAELWEVSTAVSLASVSRL
jgi:hypothetical protein